MVAGTIAKAVRAERAVRGRRLGLRFVAAGACCWLARPAIGPIDMAIVGGCSD